MTGWKRTAGIGLLWGLLAGSAAGDLIPTPNFTAHPIPTGSVPAPESAGWEYLHLGLLVLALTLATYWALVTRSRRNLFLLSIGALVWFGFVRMGCICPIGAIQNVTLGIFDAGYSVPLWVIGFFALPLLVTLFFGRTFCAAVCPLGAVQELTAVKSVRVPEWLDQTLGLIPFIYLGAAVIFAATGTAFLICRYDPYVAFFRLDGNANIVLFGMLLLGIGLFVGRPYCRYLCPYGAILGVLSRFSRWHVSIPPDKCINCRLCEDVCPYGAIDPPTVAPTPAEAQRGKRRLGIVLLVSPLLVIVLAGAGRLLAGPLSGLDPEVQLAEQMRREELGLTDVTTDASDAFRSARRPVAELYATAVARRERFAWLGIALGAWVGLVVSTKLVALSVRPKRGDYQPNRSGCVSCGRCFWYCPVEQVRLGLAPSVTEVVESR